MNKFVIEQKITAFVNRYSVYESSGDGQKGQMVCFVEQKRLAFKEEILFYTDESKQSQAFKVKAEKALDVRGKFFVTNPEGTIIGVLRKAFKASLLRSTWHVLGIDGQEKPLMIVQERSKTLAIFRRIWGLVPYLGELPFLFKYHFSFVLPNDGQEVATYIKTTRFRDHYELTILDQGVITQFGWQTLVAQAVLLDALQDR